MLTYINRLKWEERTFAPWLLITGIIESRDQYSVFYLRTRENCSNWLGCLSLTYPFGSSFRPPFFNHDVAHTRWLSSNCKLWLELDSSNKRGKKERAFTWPNPWKNIWLGNWNWNWKDIIRLSRWILKKESDLTKPKNHQKLF